MGFRGIPKFRFGTGAHGNERAAKLDGIVLLGETLLQFNVPFNRYSVSGRATNVGAQTPPRLSQRLPTNRERQQVHDLIRQRSTEVKRADLLKVVSRSARWSRVVSRDDKITTVKTLPY